MLYHSQLFKKNENGLLCFSMVIWEISRTQNIYFLWKIQFCKIIWGGGIYISLHSEWSQTLKPFIQTGNTRTPNNQTRIVTDGVCFSHEYHIFGICFSVDLHYTIIFTLQSATTDRKNTATHQAAMLLNYFKKIQSPCLYIWQLKS